eukprot:scaffold141812_cov22-Tisochrysis_lutea.AAC.2
MSKGAAHAVYTIEADLPDARDGAAHALFILDNDLPDGCLHWMCFVEVSWATVGGIGEQRGTCLFLVPCFLSSRLHPSALEPEHSHKLFA